VILAGGYDFNRSRDLINRLDRIGLGSQSRGFAQCLAGVRVALLARLISHIYVALDANGRLI
jgi:hypothetical protein